MNEDKALETAVKMAFEADVILGAQRMQTLMDAAERAAKLRRVRRLFGRWGGPTLLAASLATGLGVSALFVGQETRQGRIDGVSEAIGLLCELDGVSEETVAAGSPGEMLLAWQEAPCADLL